MREEKPESIKKKKPSKAAVLAILITVIVIISISVVIIYAFNYYGKSLSGIWIDENGHTFEFTGNQVIKAFPGHTIYSSSVGDFYGHYPNVFVVGSYHIIGDKITFTWSNGASEQSSIEYRSKDEIAINNRRMVRVSPEQQMEICSCEVCLQYNR